YGRSSKRTNWLLIKHRDEYAHRGDHDQLLAEDRSVASGRPMAQIEAGKGRAPKPFMLARKGARVAKADAVWHSNRDEGSGSASGEGESVVKARTSSRSTRAGSRSVGAGNRAALAGGSARASGSTQASQRTGQSKAGKRMRGRMPEFISPQLAKLVDRPPAG